MDVVGEIGADGCRADGEARCPLGNQLLGVGEAGVAACGQVGDELPRGKAGGGKSFGTHGPDGGDPGQGGELVPQVGQVEPEEGCVDCGFNLGAAFSCEESGIADEERSVRGCEHGQRIGRALDEGGIRAVEVLEEDAGVGDGAAAGGVGCDAADARQGVGDGCVAGIFDEQKNAADFDPRSDGAAGDDGELGCEGRDGDQAEIGCAGVEFGCADGGRRVMHVVVLT